ncbi:MAG: hypothetical protein WB502_02910 [Thermoactinomyces sp.]
MQVDTDSKKRQLLLEWVCSLQPYHILFAKPGERVDRNQVLKRISVENFKCYSECIYILLIEQNTVKIPVYIGKSRHPLKRWDFHLRSWSREKGPYQKWSALLTDTEKKTKYPMFLMIAPDYSIQKPVIAGFPKTIGSIEYQLIGLTSDGYPNFLLNSEGNRR